MGDLLEELSETKAGLASWLIEQGLVGIEQEDLLRGYCEKLVEIGVPVYRIHVAQRAFHPQFGGVGFDWLRDGEVSQEHYAHTETPLERWVTSPLYNLLQNGIGEMRHKLEHGEIDNRFPLLQELYRAGGTDYFATGLAFEELDDKDWIDPNNTPEGFLISWTSDAPGGFSKEHLNLIRSVLPHLGLALKSSSNRRMARDLLSVYLGSDAGNRVLSGEINRGSLREIEAVICFFDLAGFTGLAERTDGNQLIEMLNDYFGLAVNAIHSNGGSILKFMGDGLLAMFDKGSMGEAAQAALETAVELREQITERNVTRKALGVPMTGFTLALHTGRILYGNIGAETRLDFTVIGPAVNLAARLSSMHSSLEQDLIISDPVRRLAVDADYDLVSLGRYMVRGVPDPLELFTIYDNRSGN